MSKQFVVVDGELFISQALVALAVEVASPPAAVDREKEAGLRIATIASEVQARVSSDDALSSRIG